VNSEISDVSDTSFWVAYYRAKESLRKDSLFQDPLAQLLVGDRGKAISDSMGHISKYTEWSVVSRTVIIDRFIQRLTLEGVDAVVNLGAGLDTRPYRLDLPATLQWVEADYPHIISYKSEKLQQLKPRVNLSRVAVDLSNASERKAFLRSVAPTAKKILVLTEGVIPYLTEAQVADLSRDLLAEERISFWITEYFNPKVYPYLKSTVMKAKLQKAPFQFYPEQWLPFFQNLGWKEKETRFSGEIAVEFKRRPPAPAWVKLIWPLIPKQVREESLRMSGHTVFERP
jgi:methyltransferase (TIGR00027 family)